MVTALTGQARRWRSRATRAAWIAGPVALFTSVAYIGSGLRTGALHIAGVAAATVFGAAAVVSLLASARAGRQSPAGFVDTDAAADLVGATEL